MRTIMHIDFNSFFASVEQQANPHLRGKPVGVTGGDRMTRTVLCTASVEAKKLGVRTAMRIPEALAICPQLIIVPGDSEKYLTITKKFLGILKDYTPLIEVFSIDEAFLELPPATTTPEALAIAKDIKVRLSKSVGAFITCSVGISYNKFIAKLASSLQKPDGLVVIGSEEEAMRVLDKTGLDEVCGIGRRTKKRLNSMGIYSFETLRKLPKENLVASFKSYGELLYNWSRGVDHAPVVPFYDKAEVKSIGHRYTTEHNTADTKEIKQLLLKLTELIARRLRAKKLVGRVVVCHFRYSKMHEDSYFEGDGMQVTINATSDGLEIFQAAWRIFNSLWSGEKIRLIGVSVSGLRGVGAENLKLFEDIEKQKNIIRAMDNINDRFGEFSLQRGVLLESADIHRKANPFLADRRFKL